MAASRKPKNIDSRCWFYETPGGGLEIIVIPDTKTGMHRIDPRTLRKSIENMYGVKLNPVKTPRR